MWTFETMVLGSDWTRSGHTYHSQSDAILAALKWVGICLENKGAVSVRLAYWEDGMAYGTEGRKFEP